MAPLGGILSLCRLNRTNFITFHRLIAMIICEEDWIGTFWSVNMPTQERRQQDVFTFMHKELQPCQKKSYPPNP
ncbi:hypothetical protein HMPREF9080_02275 [Cardiobacterium valvarum F0432]|uniref:Uncharacterized protein n=1 Tax=Cardiobacterium valvarum F0432 TaxID=797473 RepID=G9ZHM5_9GAMM|nr:hypothetical protein HMPREF9080_02275 [Cardiobacterium valvarum F0432]